MRYFTKNNNNITEEKSTKENTNEMLEISGCIFFMRVFQMDTMLYMNKIIINKSITP